MTVELDPHGPLLPILESPDRGAGASRGRSYTYGANDVAEFPLQCRGLASRAATFTSFDMFRHPRYGHHKHHRRFWQDLEDGRRKEDDKVGGFVIFLACIAAIGGALFGYDTGVVSGALLKIREDFYVSNVEAEELVTVTIVMAVLGTLAAGPLNNQFGRKPVIIASASLFFLGSVVMAAANSLRVLLIGRGVVGLAVGATALTTPVYIAEAAPHQLRGVLVTMNTFMITLGALAAAIVDGAYAETEQGWRYMLGLAGVPAILMVIGFFFLPESPRWLMRNGQTKKAKEVLQMIRGGHDVSAELAEIAASISESDVHLKATSAKAKQERAIRRSISEQAASGVGLGLAGSHQQGSYHAAGGAPGRRGSAPGAAGGYSSLSAGGVGSGSSLASKHIGGPEDLQKEKEEEENEKPSYATLFTDPPIRRALILGCTVMAIQQLTGITMIMYYSSSIIAMGGVSNTMAIKLAAALAASQVLGVGLGLFLVDKLGRRPIMLWSQFASTLALFGLAISFYLSSRNSPPVEYSDESCSSYDNIFAGRIVVTDCMQCVQNIGCGYCESLHACFADFDAEDDRAMDRCPGGVDTYSSSSCNFAGSGGDIYATLAIVFQFVYLFVFGAGMGGLPWTVCSEIFPLHVRSLGTGVTTACNWIGNIFVSSSFLTFASPGVLNTHGTFFMYACIALIGWVILYLRMPEIKGLSLEEVEQLFVDDNDESSVDEDEERLDDDLGAAEELRRLPSLGEDGESVGLAFYDGANDGIEGAMCIDGEPHPMVAAPSHGSGKITHPLADIGGSINAKEGDQLLRGNNGNGHGHGTHHSRDGYTFLN